MNFSYLPKTSIWNALSLSGKSMETPKGIFYWSSRAKAEADIDGTIGIAQNDDGTVSHLEIAEEWAGHKVMERLPKARVFGYAPIQGVESLRKKWLAGILKRCPGFAQSATMPVVTSGITHSLAIAARLLLDPGQTIIISDKSWENYSHIFTDVQRAKIVEFPMFTGEGAFHFDAVIGACREVASLQGKVVLLLNFPHNQTGFMPTTTDCEQLASRVHGLCKEMPSVPFVVLLDDAYEGYVYTCEAQSYSPLAQLFASFPNLTVGKMDGISKVMLAYGYRIGFITFFLNSLDGKPFSDGFLKGVNAEMGSKIGGFIRGEISQANHHGQILADALMDNWPEVENERAKVVSLLEERWTVMKKAIDDAYAKYGKEKIWVDPCCGGFFCYVNLEKALDAQDIAEKLLKQKRVGVVPSGHGLRVAFAAVPKDKIPRMIGAIFEVAYGA